MLLTEFPYPSGDLHVGHWYTFAVTDILARYLRMRGDEVMYPIGFDAFGLPAENAAIKHETTPAAWTKQNIERMTEQLRSMHASFDWDRLVDTSHPDYYRWTQWIFLRLYEQGLAYRAKTKVNWCPNDKTVLANEQVVNGCCERCDTPVEQKDLEQWMFKTTAFADALYDELENLDWPQTTKSAQQNWIGRSRGSRITWKLRMVPGQKDDAHSVETFTTRPDTIYGVTFLAISPELAQKWIDIGWQASNGVQEYVKRALGKRDLERQAAGKEKTGVDADVKAVHPLTGELVPVLVADYVLGSYGTGAVMGVPAHDERDHEFAEALGLPIGDGKLTDEAVGKKETTYRLRDWVLSRQRYWGCPIPMIHCASCGYVPVAEDQLPVVLPELADFKPADDGRSPLAKATDWLKAKCPKCSGDAERETDTMDTFVDSSWYFLRYADPNNPQTFASQEQLAQWMPVPMYVGGPEHNTMHLLYARFITKALHAGGHLQFSEPFTARRNHSVILGPDGMRMSKSRGNVVDPDTEVAKYGADTVRMYLAFMGPYSDQTMPWDPNGITGVHRFIKRVQVLFEQPTGEANADIERALHAATKKVGSDIAVMKYNTAVSELMKLLNIIEEHGKTLTAAQRERFLLILAPFAPELAEQLFPGVHQKSWPSYDESMLKTDTVELPVQVNGKLRGSISIAPDAAESDAVFAAKQDENVAKHLGDGAPEKVIYVPGRMLNFVVK